MLFLYAVELSEGVGGFGCYSCCSRLFGREVLVNGLEPVMNYRKAGKVTG